MKNELKNHHPYCAETYRASREYHTGWVCMCRLLKQYDEWRGITNQGHTASELRMMEKKDGKG
mgnify:CR=1 FL=1